jgi:hypothetical protein
MWRHITGIEQPAKKIKLNNNEKLERKRSRSTIFAAAEFTVEFSFADCLPTDLRCCSEVSWEITDSSLKLEDPIIMKN